MMPLPVAPIFYVRAQGAYWTSITAYPYVTSSNTIAGAVVAGAGFGPQVVDYVREL